MSPRPPPHDRQPDPGFRLDLPGPASGGSGLDALQREIAGRSLPPVHAWHPERCGEIDIRIARDGRWYHEGRPIERERLVRLFASVLRVDDDGTWLVTPAERLRIRVDDAPFTAVALERLGTPEVPVLAFLTNLGERVVVDAEHPIRVEYATSDGEPAPYVRVRDRLDALIARQTFIELAGLAEQRGALLGVVSSGEFMTLGAADADDAASGAGAPHR